MPVRRQQPQTLDDRSGGRGYGYGGSPVGGRTSSPVGGFGPDANALSRMGERSYQSLYERIRHEDERSREEDEREEPLEQTPVDAFFHGLYQFGSGLAQGPESVRRMAGADDPFSQGLSFVASLPAGTFGAMPQGLAQGYEAAFGRGVADDDDEVQRLNASQQAASAVNAGINLVGPWFGGSGSMLRGGARTIRAGIGALIDEVAESAGRKAAQEVAETGARGLFRTIAGEAAEEAGEEFVQSLADDARFETADEGSLGRAAQSAALGAVGGAIMSGAGYGLNWAATKITGADSKVAAPANQQTKSDLPDADRRAVAYGTGTVAPTYLSDSAREVMAQRTEGRSADWAGSNSMLVLPYDNSFNMDQAKIGTEEVRGIFYAPDNGASARRIAQGLRMSDRDAAELFASDDWEDRLKSRVAELLDAGTPFEMWWARNPATKGRQPIQTNVVELFDGKGLMLHPTVVPYVGADADGDKMFATFSADATENASYATDLIIDPETGQLAIDGEAWMRSGIAPTVSRDAVERAVTAALGVQTSAYASRGNTVDTSSIDVDGIVDDVMSGLSNTDQEAGYGSVGRALVSLRDQVTDAGLNGGRVVAEAVYNLSHDDESSFVNVLRNTIDSYTHVLGEAVEVPGGQRDDEAAPGVPAQGRLSGKPTMARLLVDMNMVTFAVNQTKNSPFRQNGQLGMLGKAFPSYVDHGMETLRNIWGQWADVGKMENIIVACLNETSQGGSVENSIEGMVRGYVTSHTLLGNAPVARTRDERAELYRRFVQAKNESVRMVNEAHEVLTSYGVVHDLSPLMHEIRFDEGRDFLADENNASEFYRMMQAVPFGAIFDDSGIDESLRGLSLREMVEYANEGTNRMDRSVLRSSLGEAINTEFNRIRDAQSRTTRIVAGTVREALSEVTRRLRSIAGRMVDGELSRVDRIEAKYLLDEVSQFVGPDAMFDVGMTDYTTFLNSEWGRELASGDPDRAYNAVVSLAWTGQFRNAVRDIHDAGGDERLRSAIIHRLTEASRVDDLHTVVAQQLIESESGYSSLLDYLTDLSIPYSVKEKQVREHFTDALYGDMDLLVSSMKDKASEFDMTDINARRKRASRYMKSARVAAYDECQSDLRVFQNETEKVPDHLFEAAMDELVQDSLIDIGYDSAAMMIYDAMYFGNPSIEKATIEMSSQQRANGIETMRWGGPLAVTEQMIDAPLGHVSMEQFASNRYLITSVLSGSIEGLWVYDPMRPELDATWITRDTLFQEANGSYDPRRGPTRNDWMALLRLNPSFMSMLAPQRVVVSVADGRAVVGTGETQGIGSYMAKYVSDHQFTGISDKLAYRSYSRARRHVRNRLNELPGLLPKIVTCIDGIENMTDPRSIKRAVEEVMDEIVDYATRRALTVRGGEPDSDMDRTMRANRLITLMRDVDDLVITCANIESAAQISSAAERRVAEEARAATSAFIIKQAIARSLGADSTKEYVRHEPIEDDLFDTDRIQSEIDDLTENVLTIYALVSESAGAKVMDDALRLSEASLADIDAMIDATDADDDAKNRSKQRARHPSEIIMEAMSTRDDSASILRAKDLMVYDGNPVTNDFINAAMDKVSRLVGESGDRTAFSGERMTELMTLVRDQDTAKLMKIRDEVNSLTLRHVIRDINLDTGTKSNPNMLALICEIGETERRIVEIARKAVNEVFPEGTTWQQDDEQFIVHAMPRSHVLNPYVQAIVTKLNATDVPAGASPLRTGVNGIRYRTDVAYGMIPSDLLCDVPPRALTAAQLADFGSVCRDFDLSQVQFARPMYDDAPIDLASVQPGSPQAATLQSFQYDPEDRGVTWVVGSLTPEEIQLVTSDAYPFPVHVFVPTDCANGLCCAHQHPKMDRAGGDYLSIKNIINRINQHAQEAMSIKMKKAPGLLDIVGGNRNWCTSMAHEIRVSSQPNGSVSQVTWQQIHDVFEMRRGEVTDVIADFLRDESMKALGFDRPQAVILSNNIVTGMSLGFMRPDGTTFRRVAHKSYVDSQEALSAFIGTVLAEEPGSELVSARPFESTLTQTAMRGMCHVLDSNPQDMSDEEFRQAFIDGMTHLDHVGRVSVPIADVIAAVEPVGIAHGDYVLASTNASLVNSLLDARGPADARRSLTAFAVDSGLTAEMDSKTRHTIESFNRSYRLVYGDLDSSRPSPTICRVFVDRSEMPSRYTRNSSYVSGGSIGNREVQLIHELLSHSASTNDGIASVPENLLVPDGVALAMDPRSISRAVSWSKHTRQPIAIPMDYIESMGLPQATTVYLNQGQSARIATSKGDIRVRVCRPYLVSDAVAVAADATSKNVAMPDVRLVMESTPGMSMVDGSSYINADTARVIFSERNSAESRTVQSIVGSNVHGVTSMATPDQVGQMVDDVRSGDWSRLNLSVMQQSGLSDELVREEVLRYVDWYERSDGSCVTRPTASAGWVVSFLSTRDINTGEIVLTPITISQSGPNVQITSVAIHKYGDTVNMTYDARMSLGNELSGDGKPRLYAHKIATTGFSYKTMSIPVEPGDFEQVIGAELPTTYATVGGNALPMNAIIDHLALGSRMADIDNRVAAHSMWYFSHGIMAVNAYLEPDGNGGLRLREHLRRKMIENPTVYTPERMRSLIVGNGDNKIRYMVATGEIELSDEPETNRLIRAVAKRCGRGASLNDVLTSFPIRDKDADALLSFNRIAPEDSVSDSPAVSDAIETFGSIPQRDVVSARDIDYGIVLGEIVWDENHRNRLFNFIDPRLCPKSLQEDDGNVRTVFSSDGKMYVYVGNDDNGNPIPSKVRVFVGPILNLGKTNQEGRPSRTAKRGAQMRSSQALDMDMLDEDRDFFIKMFARETGRSDVFDAMRPRPGESTRDSDEAIGYELSPRQASMARQTLFDSQSQREYRHRLRNAGEVYERFYPVDDKRHGELITNITQLSKVPEVMTAVTRLNQALSGESGPRVNLSMDAVNMLVVTSASDLFIKNRGNNSVPLGQYIQHINDMADNVEAGKLPIVNRVNKTTKETRVATALLPRQLARYLYDASPRLRQSFATFGEFQEAMMREQQVTREITETQRDEGKKRSIFMLNDWLMMNWGERPNSGHVWGETSMRDIIAGDDALIQAIYGRTFDDQQVRATKEMAKRNAERIAAQAAFNDTGVETQVEDEGSRAGFVSRYDTRQRGVISGFLSNLSELAKFMSMLNPFISVANVTDRVVHQGFTDAMMQWCMNNGVGPYRSNFVPDQDVVKMGARSNDASKVFDAIFYASIDGNEAELMSSIHGMQDIDDYLAQRRERMESDRLFVIPRKTVDWVFEMAGGGKVFQDRQISIWFNQFSRIISSKRFAEQFGPSGVPLLTKVESGRTILEQRWEQEPGMLLAEVFSDRSNPYYVAARQALNASRAGEATQANIMYALYQHLAKRSPAFEFFSTTFVSRFMLYSTNMAGRVLNLVAPVSAVNHLVTDWAARRLDPTGKWGFEEMQMYTSFREALAVDAMHMAPAILALVVGMIPGLLEPPEDEDKRGNPDEWTIMGMRIGDDWLISDIMGLALPLSTFFASARTGDMRFDLLWNGITQACYNNPVLKASTAVEVFFDPESSFHDLEDQFIRDQEDYADAPGGSPDPLTWISGQLAGGTVSYLSQFVTPSFVRDLLTSYPIQRYERSYKLVEQMDERGQVILDPDTGLPAYQATEYIDAQIRRVTRNQPVAGLFMDIINGVWLTGTTGYTGFEMPRTVYYDDAQLESMRMFSVNDENGDPLPADQQQEKVLAVLSVLMANDDMEELAASGFYIDYDTRMMVGDTIHDILKQMAKTYSEMSETGQLDYYVLGNGDYHAGRAIREQIKQDYYDERDFWNSLYYDKLWSEPLATRLTTYNRYNTTYARDDDGDIYATGQYRSINPLFWHAPGTLADGTPTAGWENDWNSVSAVTGQAMDQRALIPTEAGRLDVPDIDSLDDESNDGWSASWPGYSYSRSTDGDGYDDGWGYGGGGSGYRRSYGGYRRGGGGGGYSPNIYSRLPNVYAPSARTMYAERVYGPNYDYLRPNFETKGSREAYKRSDI